MKSHAICFTLLTTVAISIAASFPAQAQRARVFVSVNGNDANPCTAQSPCKTFQHAHDVVLAGGEISVLDTGGYGPVTITKSVSIVSVLGQASVLASTNGFGITINGGATDTINLTGLIIEGAGANGTVGVVFHSGGSLTVENCIIRQLNAGGISFNPNSSSALSVSNTIIADIPFNEGIFVFGTASNIAIKAVVNNVQLYNLSSGLTSDGRGNPGGAINISIADSAVNNSSGGFQVVWEAPSAPVSVAVARSTIANNSVGLFANGANATIRVAASTISGNTSGWSTFSGGIILSAGNNTIEGNLDGNPPPPTYVMK